MQSLSEDDWGNYSGKSLRHPRNAEFVTGRVTIANNRKVIRISIGKIVCELLSIKKSDRVVVYINKNSRHQLLIEKSNEPNSYALLDNGTKRNNFLSFAFRYDFNEPFRLSQTIILDFDANDDGILIVDLEKMKWRN